MSGPPSNAGHEGARGTPGGGGECLSEAAALRAAHGEGNAAETAHASACPVCAARVAEALREAEFLGRARGLLGDDLGPIGAPRLAGYRALGVISTGAQGVVYRARQESTQRTVAIKVLAAEPSRGKDEGSRQGEKSAASSTRRRLRAEREVEIIARLRHPNIVAVHESRTVGADRDGAGGRVALVMEYVDGVPLDRWEPLSDKPAASGAGEEADRLRAVLRVFAAVCGAVHHAHLNGVIHRDLKPDNILVTREGRPVVLDFGIAKLNAVAGRAGDLHTTSPGDFAGTPAYASPEQVSGKPDEADALTDVYSLGVVLYKLVCGKLPYDLGESIFEAARVIGSVEPAPPRREGAAIPRDLEAVILRSLQKKKEDRYQSAAALGRDVERFLAGEPVEARSESGWYLLRKAVMVNRKRLGLAGGAAAVLAGAGIAVAMSLASARASSRQAEAQRTKARAEHVRARAVTELLRDAMPNADPQRPELNNLIGKGLSRLYYRIETGAFAEDADVDQEIRRLWGSVYTGFGGKAATQVEYAEVSLRHGLVQLRMQQQSGGCGGASEAVIASSLHQLAGVLLVRNRFGEAQTTCAEALTLRERLKEAGDGGALLVCESQALMARILLARGDKAGAEKLADNTLAGLEAVPERDADLLIASMRALKARLRLGEGAYAAAEPLVLDALVRRLRVLPVDDPETMASLGDAADLAEKAPALALSQQLRAVWGGGEEAALRAETDGAGAASALRRDIPVILGPARGSNAGPGGANYGRTGSLQRMVMLEEALLGGESLALVGTLLQQVEAAVIERQPAARAAADLRAAEILGKRLGPDSLAVLVCIQDAAVTLAFEGRCDEAVSLAERSCAIWNGVPEAARDKLMTANAHRYLLWFLALAGRHQDAVAEGAKAKAMLTAVVGTEHHAVAFCQAVAALSMLNLGDLNGADEGSRAALEAAEASAATPFDQLSHIRFIRAHVLLTLDTRPENRAKARTLLERAWQAYYRVVSSSFVWRATLLEDLVTVAEADGDAGAAQKWRSHAAAPPEAQTP